MKPNANSETVGPLNELQPLKWMALGMALAGLGTGIALTVSPEGIGKEYINFISQMPPLSFIYHGIVNTPEYVTQIAISSLVKSGLASVILWLSMKEQQLIVESRELKNKVTKSKSREYYDIGRWEEPVVKLTKEFFKHPSLETFSYLVTRATHFPVENANVRKSIQVGLSALGVALGAMPQ